MNAFVTALVPIIILIILGYVLRRSGFLPDETWPGMEKLTYFILLPSLLVRTLGKQTLAGVPWPAMLTVVVGTLMISAVVLILLHILRSKNNATFTSVFQGGVRFNTYITLAVAQSLYGATGLAMGSVAAGFMIVLINLLCISVFVIWGKASIRGIFPFVREVFGNPLIVACTIGWFLSISGIGLPYLAGDILEIVGRAALPFGLLAVGAALKPETIRGQVNPIAISTIAQFGLKPLAAAVLIFYTGLTGVEAGVLLIAFMTPTSPAGYILAKQLGGDTETMASIITCQTLLAFIMMPIIGLLLL
ncbi:MAG: AEC family transporter [Desulfobulbaceae bacterium]|nr:AEC family transporter [Desulfobulbaceae bacterium]